MSVRLFSRRWLAAVLVACCASVISIVAPSFVMAQTDPAAEAFLNSIYSAYKGSSRGIPLNSDATIQRYFEPSLATEIIKDAADAKKRDEVPKLSGDPFVDSQEWEIPKFSVAVKDTGADKAVGTVTITNFGKEIPLILNLVKLPDGWRIANIMWERGDTLRGLYFKGEPQPPAIKKKPGKASKKPPPKSAKKPPKREKKS